MSSLVVRVVGCRNFCGSGPFLTVFGFYTLFVKIFNILFYKFRHRTPEHKSRFLTSFKSMFRNQRDWNFCYTVVLFLKILFFRFYSISWNIIYNILKIHLKQSEDTLSGNKIYKIKVILLILWQYLTVFYKGQTAGEEENKDNDDLWGSSLVLQ